MTYRPPENLENLDSKGPDATAEAAPPTPAPALHGAPTPAIAMPGDSDGDAALPTKPAADKAGDKP